MTLGSPILLHADEQGHDHLEWDLDDEDKSFGEGSNPHFAYGTLWDCEDFTLANSFADSPTLFTPFTSLNPTPRLSGLDKFDIESDSSVDEDLLATPVTPAHQLSGSLPSPAPPATPKKLVSAMPRPRGRRIKKEQKGRTQKAKILTQSAPTLSKEKPLSAPSSSPSFATTTLAERIKSRPSRAASARLSAALWIGEKPCYKDELQSDAVSSDGDNGSVYVPEEIKMASGPHLPFKSVRAMSESDEDAPSDDDDGMMTTITSTRNSSASTTCLPRKSPKRDGENRRQQNMKAQKKYRQKVGQRQEALLRLAARARDLVKLHSGHKGCKVVRDLRQALVLYDDDLDDLA